jgi:capsular exopolysaccharide synthesis family protein
MLSSKKMREFVQSLKEHYDYIFIDAPPIGLVTDAGIISTYTDGTLFVVGANEADTEMAKVSKERLDNVGANILGTVLNKFEANSSEEDYYMYYYQEEKGRRASRKKKK